MRHEPCVCDKAPVAMLTWSVDDGWKECLQSKDADIDWWLDPAPCTARGAANRNWHNGDPKTKIIASNPKAKQKHGQELIICKIHVKRYTKRCERCICLKSLSKVWTIDIWYFDKSWNLKECRVGLECLCEIARRRRSEDVSCPRIKSLIGRGTHFSHQF